MKRMWVMWIALMILFLSTMMWAARIEMRFQEIEMRINRIEQK